MFISTTIIKVCNMGSLFEPFSRGDLLVGGLNFITMYCSNFALKFVNFKKKNRYVGPDSDFPPPP